MSHWSKISKSIISWTWAVLFSFRSIVTVETQRIDCNDLTFWQACRRNDFKLKIGAISYALFALFLKLGYHIIVIIDASLVDRCYDWSTTSDNSTIDREVLLIIKRLWDLVLRILNHAISEYRTLIWISLSTVLSHAHRIIDCLSVLKFISKLVHLRLILLIQIYWWVLTHSLRNVLSRDWTIRIMSILSKLSSTRPMRTKILHASFLFNIQIIIAKVWVATKWIQLLAILIWLLSAHILYFS